MEKLKIDNDIKVFYVTADSFPDGILPAHQKLHKMIPYSTDRKYFGISRPENGSGIVYRAAAEEMTPGEAEKLNLESLVLKKGNYISETLRDYAKDISSISRTFNELLSQPGLDPQGYCVEWYINNTDMKCMIRLEE
ncbi:hypothetical protein [Solitalea canadensis]|uniref:Putative transcription activator n=1 Tax=Solitalea canadensis (strain ATCC 29591 / DSM 3403 / JCM 21819 / LMG 8368 / NBRC 15130 / NCIMB 12057 / USAM 9D) TaxID=929556 RepID=H8KSZ9_SOLCM|nr:hypothetical protein [Solitalea canadensis]AFD05570.1 putative transcription activator [Solitalea canadensis DSM 3403]